VADYREVFVGIDVAKLRNAVAIADAGREGEVRFFGEVEGATGTVHAVVRRRLSETGSSAWLNAA
jgi:transposase